MDLKRKIISAPFLLHFFLFLVSVYPLVTSVLFEILFCPLFYQSRLSHRYTDDYEWNFTYFKCFLHRSEIPLTLNISFGAYRSTIMCFYFPCPHLIFVFIYLFTFCVHCRCWFFLCCDAAFSRYSETH